MEPDLIIAFGGAVKATPGCGVIEGLLVPYGSEAELDADGEFFTSRTDFGLRLPAAVKLHYHHGMNSSLGRTPLAWAELERREDGIWFKADLDEDLEEWESGEREKATRYRQSVLKLARDGQLGASSGAAAHVVVRQAAGKGVRISRWPLAEASVTPTPANARTVGTVSMKALAEVPDPLGEADEADACPECGHAKSLAEHSARIVAANTDYASRLEARLEARVKAGRVLSAANLTELSAVLAAYHAVSERLRSLLDRARPAPASPEGAMPPVSPVVSPVLEPGAEPLADEDPVPSRLLADAFAIVADGPDWAIPSPGGSHA